MIKKKRISTFLSFSHHAYSKIIHKKEHTYPHVNSSPTKPVSYFYYDVPVSKCHSQFLHQHNYNLLFSGIHHKTYFCHSDWHIVKKYFHCAENLVPVPFQDQVQILEFDSTGREYKNSEHGITISIPEGAIPQGEIVHMEVAVALHGPFQFSSGKRPISPILWLCTQEDVTFLKPFTIVLPHTMIDLSPDDVQKFGVSFAKADHRSTTLHDGKQKYVFKSFRQDVTAALETDNGRGFAILQVDHCCFLCLQMNEKDKVPPEIAHQMAKKMGYYIHCIECLEAQYPSASPPRDVIHFCVSYFLETCIKVLTVSKTQCHEFHSSRHNNVSYI